MVGVAREPIRLGGAPLPDGRGQGIGAPFHLGAARGRKLLR